MILLALHIFERNGIIAYALPEPTSGKTHESDLVLFGEYKRAFRRLL